MTLKPNATLLPVRGDCEMTRPLRTVEYRERTVPSLQPLRAIAPRAVKDVSVKKGMTQRTRGCGDVEVTSADASTPKVVLAWIQKPDEVAEQIRKVAREARKRHGVVTQERY